MRVIISTLQYLKYSVYYEKHLSLSVSGETLLLLMGWKIVVLMELVHHTPTFIHIKPAVCSHRDSKQPKPPPGTKWKEVRHDNKVTWLVSWTENIQGSIKYIMLNPSSRIKVPVLSQTFHAFISLFLNIFTSVKENLCVCVCAGGEGLAEV